MHKPKIFLAMGAALVVSLLAACGSQSAGGLRNAGDLPPGGYAVDGIARVRPGAPQSLGSMTICLTHPGRAVITGVQPVRPLGTIVVQSYSVRPSPFMSGGEALGDGHGPLANFGFTPGRHTVPIVCNNKTGAAYELGIQMTKDSPADVGAAGWTVTYKFGGQTADFTIPLAVELCSEWSANAPACRHLDRRLVAEEG